MLDREVVLRHIKEMPIDEFQSVICKALENGGIKYKIGGEPEEWFIPLSELFYEGCLTDESKRHD